MRVSSFVFCLILFIQILLPNCATTGAKATIDDIVQDITTYLDTGYETTRFKNTLTMLRLETPLRGRNPSIEMKILQSRAGTGSRRRMSCGACTLAMTVVLSWIRTNPPRELVIRRSVQLCTVFNIQTNTVCRGFVKSHVDLALFLYAARQATGNPITPGEICSLAVYPTCNMSNDILSRYQWSFDLDYLGPKPPVQSPKPIDHDAPTMEVLHITDVHVDPTYTPGSNAKCLEITCCRNDTPGSVKPDSEAVAGYWGDYRDCDSPFHGFANLVEQAAQSHPNVSYIMFTGDAVDHAMWTTNEERNVEVYKQVVAKIRSEFPDVPLLPVIGNHEPHPVNVWVDFSNKENLTELEKQFQFSTDWVYKMASEEWSQWLPNSIQSSVEQGGSYAFEVMPGLIVVSLNNNFCYTYNWWLMYRNEDPAGQLRWLAETLRDAEEAGKKVHIMAHIAGNTYNCLAAWRQQYQRILFRFEDTVVAQFHGHEHTDYFTLYFDPKNADRPTGIAFTSGSATPYTDVNPNYRVYTIEAQGDYRVLDHETWSFNLTAANLAGEEVLPDWYKLYSFNEAYGTPSVLPHDMYEFWKKLAMDTEMQMLYFGHTVRNADPFLARGCDARCTERLLCDIVDPHPGVRSKCTLFSTPQRPRHYVDEDEEEIYGVEENELDTVFSDLLE